MHALPITPDAVYLVDTFTVPPAARAELEAAMARNRSFLRTLPGFLGDLVLERSQGEGWDLATIAAWGSPAAIAHAKEQVRAYYQRIGFDLPAQLARWGVTLTRTIGGAVTTPSMAEAAAPADR